MTLGRIEPQEINELLFGKIFSQGVDFAAKAPNSRAVVEGYRVKSQGRGINDFGCRFRFASFKSRKIRSR